MKKFILKAVLFIIIAFLLLNAWGYLILHSDLLSDRLSWYFSLRAALKSHEHIQGQVLILGDSVCKQFFPLSTPYSLATNARVLAAGHYILAANAIAADKDKSLRYIVLLSVPQVIGYRFEESQTYSNFMKPFYTLGNLHYISKSLQAKINEKKISRLAILPFVKAAPCFSDVDFGQTKKRKQRRVLSDVAIEYLRKLADLCKQHNITLILASPPVQKKQKRISRDWKKMRKQIRQYKLQHIFKGYFESIIYLDENNFKDNVHMDLEYVRQNRKKILRKILPDGVLELIE